MDIRMSRLEKMISEKNVTTPATSKAVEEVVYLWFNLNFNNCPLRRNEFPAFLRITFFNSNKNRADGYFVQRITLNLANQMRHRKLDAVLRIVKIKVKISPKSIGNVTSLLTNLCNNFKDSASTSNSGTLPSQTVTNPRQQINAITTRSEQKLHEKLENPGKFIIHVLYNRNSDRTSALADSGASINLLPHSIYKKLGLEALTPTRMTLELANRSITHPMGIAEDVVVRVDGFTFLADFLILRDGNESLTLNMQSEKSKLNGIQRVESINMIDIFNVPNYIGFKDLFAKMYSGSPTIHSDDSFPSSSSIKTSDSTFEEFTDEFTFPNSLPPGDDVPNLKKDFQEDTFRIISNPLFEFDNSFKSSNVNPLFEEKDKDVKIKSSSSFTLTSPEENVSIPPGIDLTLPPTFEVSSSNPTSLILTGEKVCSWKTPMFFSLVRFVWKMMTRIAIRKKIICLLATYLHKKPKPLSHPQEVEEIKEKEDEVSSDIPIHTIVMPIRITFDNPIDFNDHFSKPKDLKKDLPISFDSTTTSILPHPSLDSDSPFTAELSASVTLNSLGNEDKVFKPGILVYHAIHDKNLVTLEENLKENISSGTLLVFKEPSFLLPPPEPPDDFLNFEPILVMKNVMLNEDFYPKQVLR
ncbi:reverse transcriptase domain-containing protein [Tanacetum coccineum]|uniref:Reverse transcriptase domain-containing protein n=1 Tax=Tanacetum coccineum TaxID=301880 RepID=A0ABQ5DDQ7_9ASTR